MKVYYDPEADAAYIELSLEEPDGVVEIEEGVNLDVTNSDRIVGIEILDASKKMSLDTLFRFEVDNPLPKAA